MATGKRLVLESSPIGNASLGRSHSSLKDGKICCTQLFLLLYRDLKEVFLIVNRNVTFCKTREKFNFSEKG